MTTLTLETEPLATKVTVTDEKLIVDLVDGRSLTVPLAWYPRLLHASSKERQNWALLGEGYAIEWVELDEHIGIEGVGRQTKRREWAIVAALVIYAKSLRQWQQCSRLND